MDNITDKISDVAQVAKDTKPIWQNLPRLLRGWGSSKGSEVTDRGEDLRNLLRENARDTLASQELALDTALHILGPDFESEDVLDPTWQKRWLLGAGNVAVADEERRTWWARLLAGEIQNPGAYSLRTLSIMDSLSPLEAQLFRRFCSWVWLNGAYEPRVIVPNGYKGKVWGMTDREVAILEGAGLVVMHSVGFNIDFLEGVGLRYQNCDLDLIIVPFKNSKFRVGTTALTTSGEQVLNLVEITQNRLYLEEVVGVLGELGKIYRSARTSDGWGIGDEFDVSQIAVDDHT